MKKLVFIGICLLSFGFFSCDDDDAEEVACEVTEGTLETAAEAAFEIWEDDKDDDDKCEAAKDAIEEYNELDCADKTQFAEEFAELLVNCP